MHMKQVVIHKLEDGVSQRVIATCRLTENDTVICAGDAAFVENLAREGVRDKTGETRLFPKDGLAFLEALPFAFKSGYLMASEVEEA